MSNQQIKQLLIERNLPIENYRIVRHLTLLQDEKNRLLCIRKIAHIGCIDGPFYLGWQLQATCYWACDLFDIEIMEISRQSLEQLTSLTIQPEQFQLVDLFESPVMGYGNPILHLVYHTKLDSLAGFHYWYDWEDQITWLSPKKAMKQTQFEEDRRMIQKLIGGQFKNLLQK